MIKKYWDELVESLDLKLDDPRILPLYEGVTGYYEGKGRFYHGIRHLEHLFNLMEDHQDQINDRPAVIAAIFFHDVVYDPLSRKNEEDSAHLAENVLFLLGADQIFIDRVKDLILYTKTHDAPPSDHDAQLFLDMDMAILGTPPATYQTYAAAIRQEYQSYNDLQFCQGRLAYFLVPTLAKDRVFYTDVMEQKYGTQARINMLDEKNTLEIKLARLKPGGPQP